MELKNSITIGHEYLQQKVRCQYSQHQVALIREALQNSIDANSTEIQFDFDYKNRTLIFSDNGVGMDSYIMTNYLFALGGSFKESSRPTGGFGAAKLILLFQHEYFKITSYRNGNKYEVHGVADRYSDFTVTPSEGKGTSIEIKFLPNYAVENGTDYFSYFETMAKDYIRSCEFSCNISWNNETLTGTPKGTLFRTLDWAKFYFNPPKDGTSISNYVKVRINGLEMFNVYIAKMTTDVTVELSKNSLDILTENRDSLKYSFQNELYAIIGEFNIDKESFARLKGKTITYNGKTETSFSDICIRTVNKFQDLIVTRIRNKMNQCQERGLTDDYNKLQTVLTDVKTNFTDSIFQNIRNIFASIDIDRMDTPTTVKKEYMEKVFEVLAMKSKIMGIEEDVSKETEKLKDSFMESLTTHDFVVKVTKNIDKLPKNLDPNKGISPMYYKLAQIWCHSIRTIAFLKGQTINFKIGWVIDEKAEAMYLHDDKDGTVFLINPEMDKWWSSDSKVNNVKKIARVALHEFVHHLGYTYHDERFCVQFEEMLELLDKVSNWKEFEKDAYGHPI